MKGEQLKQKLEEYQRKLPKFENDKNLLKQQIIYEKTEAKRQEMSREISILEQKIGRLETEIRNIKSAIQSGKDYYPASI